MEFKFIEPVLLYCGGERMRALRPGEAERLLELGCVVRPRRRRVHRLEIKAPARKGLPGFRPGSPTVFRERLLEGTARLWQHRGLQGVLTHGYRPAFSSAA